MGLDMYLEGEKYVWSNWENPAANPTEDGYRLTGRTLRLGYWRKHPNLHGFLVNTFADGVDDCQRIHLERTDIQRIIEAVARDDLPHTEGFFFGFSDGSEKEETLRILRDAFAWMETKEEGVSRSVYYVASW